MTRDAIIAALPTVQSELERRGHEMRRLGKEVACLCPFHEDSKPSLRVNVEKQTWFCDPCGVGGGILDLIAKLDGITAGEVMKRTALANEPALEEPRAPSPARQNGAKGGAPGKIVKTYSYTDELGKELFQVCRMEPKTFRQRHLDAGGEWVWSMDGVRRVLYNLPAVLAASCVWIVEGEKDVDAINALGWVATCNVGGAGKWMESYAEALAGKEILLVPDNDKPGAAHMATVLEFAAGKVKSTRYVKLPDGVKDVSDFIATFPDAGAAMEGLMSIADKAAVLLRGIDLPIRAMIELESEYKEFQRRAKDQILDLGCWLPTLRRHVRGIVPGEVVTILAATGVGKTMIAQNIARCVKLKTLLFELELPGTLTFERFCAIADDRSCRSVWDTYATGGEVPFGSLDHVFTCSQSKLTPADIEILIVKSELKIGERPTLVIVDYIGLVQGSGRSRYERTSHVAEELKVIAKATNTVILATCQVGRKDDDTAEIGLNDAKDSGSIENSSGLVLGAWRGKEENSLMIDILKNTKGRPLPEPIRCQITDSMRIHETTKEPTLPYGN
jgi:hypothetical protein